MAAFFATAPEAAAMGTLACNQKGTAGDDKIKVSVPVTQLVIAMGTGQKTVNWNLGQMGWGWQQLGVPGAGIIIRPEGNPDIIMTGANTSGDLDSWFGCDTNSQYKSAIDQSGHLARSQKYLYWSDVNYNVGGC